MARYNIDKDNVSTRSQGGRSVHTYTPRSHEDLLRSHLQLDAARKAKLQNDLQRLANENERLRRDQDRAGQELRDRDDEINRLQNMLRNKPKTPPPKPKEEKPYDPGQVFQVDGQPVTLDELLDHFNVIIQRHHDLLHDKNQRICELEDKLKNQPKPRIPQRKETATQSYQKEDKGGLPPNFMDDFAHQLSLIRKEYEQVERILVERNNKLERLIEELQNKLDEYSKEIQNLRNQLETKQAGPSESTMKLMNDKDKEIQRLRDIIFELESKKQNAGPNKELESEIKKIIDGKKDAINKINSMINNINEKPDVEKERQKILHDLNDINDKLNNTISKLSESPPSTEVPMDKNNLINDLEDLKKRCQDEEDTLKNQIGFFETDQSPIVKIESSTKLDHLRPEEPTHEYRSASPQPSYKATPKPVPKHTHYPSVPCEACSEITFPYAKSTYSGKKPKRSLSRKSSHSPSQRKLIYDLYATPTKSGRSVYEPKSKSKPRSKSKGGGCCGKKGSTTSNVPYTKARDEERIMNIHNSYSPTNNYQPYNSDSRTRRGRSRTPVKFRNTL